jgi:hypothetical protein
MKQIEILLNKYLDGLTSNEEERQLREFFNRKDNILPEEWKVYRALFTFETMESEISNSQKILDDSDLSMEYDISGSSDNSKIISIRRRNRKISWLISTAVCISLILVFTFGHSGKQKNYAVINGKRYTDPEVVKQQAFEALNNVSTDDNENFAALAE